MKAEEKLKDNEINLYPNTRVVEIIGKEEVESVKFADGTQIPADTVLLATGVTPNVELAKKALQNMINEDEEQTSV